MKQPALVWRAYRQAHEWRCRPSDLFDIEDRRLAYQFDQAVWMFGGALQSELDAVEGKTKQERQRKTDAIIQRWIPEAKGKRKFKDPAQRGQSL